jgi:hypothetical protein
VTAHGRILTLAVGLFAALPLLLATRSALLAGWQPVADRGIIAMRAFDVFSSHLPLVGQYSFASAITGKLTYSIGPMLYWLLAPAAHIGAPGSLVLTMAAINVGSVLGSVILARRRGGVWLMLACAIGIALMCRSLAANNFYDIWNPSAGLFPLLLLMFLSWSLACGEYRLLPLALLVASFCAQCEDAFVPASGALIVVGIGGLVFAYLRWRARRSVDSWLPRRAGLILGASLAVLVICWTAPVIDQLSGRGNLGRVVQAATGEESSPLGLTVGNRAVARTVGIRPWWLTRPARPFSRKVEVRRPVGSSTLISAVAILGWLLIATALSIRRRRTDIAGGAMAALASCAGIWVVGSATPSQPDFLAETLGYTLWSATAAGMFAWLVAAWAAMVLSGAGGRLARIARTLGQRHPRALGLRVPGRALAALSLAALAGGLGASAEKPDEHAFEFRALAAINSRLGAVPGGHSVYLKARLDGLITPLRPEVAFALRRRGVRPLGTGAYLRSGHWYELSQHPYDYVVWMYDNHRLPVDGARVIATAHIRRGGRRHTVEVAISPAHTPARRRPTAANGRSTGCCGGSPPRNRAKRRSTIS